MKILKIYIIIIVIFILLPFTIYKAHSKIETFPLIGKTIIIDPGHGGKDPGTLYENIFEKDINLKISKELENELTKNGATVIMTRYGDYDLSTPSTTRRKKSDFDNRINLINKGVANIYLSIHINYLEDESYSGGQVFYYEDKNKHLAETIQQEFNKIAYPREIKTMPDIYMYKRLNKKGVLIECGFLSNIEERKKLISKSYQRQIALSITNGVINYFNS